MPMRHFETFSFSQAKFGEKQNLKQALQAGAKIFDRRQFFHIFELHRASLLIWFESRLSCRFLLFAAAGKIF